MGCLGAGAVDGGAASWPNGSLDARVLAAPLLLAEKPDIQSSCAAGLLAAALSPPANASQSSCPPAQMKLLITTHHILMSA